MAKHIGFATASGTGAVATKEFEGEVGLATVVPRDGELVSDFLNGGRLEWSRHFTLAGWFGDVGGLEVNRLSGACLRGPACELDSLRRGAVRMFDERGGGENRDARCEPRLGFIWRKQGRRRCEAAVQNMCVEPLIRTGVSEDMVFCCFISKEGANAFKHCRAGSGESPGSCDRGS